MIRTQRNGRWSKWHRASSWKTNDAFWITSCGIAILKKSAEVAESADDACRSCMRSCMPDTAREST